MNSKLGSVFPLAMFPGMSPRSKVEGELQSPNLKYVPENLSDDKNHRNLPGSILPLVDSLLLPRVVFELRLVNMNVTEVPKELVNLRGLHVLDLSGPKRWNIRQNQHSLPIHEPMDLLYCASLKIKAQPLLNYSVTAKLCCCPRFK